MKYKFSDSPETGTHTICQGYAALVITDQIAEIDPADAAQVALAEKCGGQPVQNDKKTSKKAPLVADSEVIQ